MSGNNYALIMSENCPLISVCMPAFNAGKFITEAIESILNQSYSNWELIIVNDGSTDDTLKKAESFTKDNRIKVFSQVNKGQCAAANKAYSYSKGQYIKFFDADDILSLDFLENQVIKINGNDNKIATARWGRFHNDDINTFKIEPANFPDTEKPIDWLVRSMNNGIITLQCALFLIPRKIITKSGLWDERLSLINDFDFFFRVILNAEEMINTNDSILYYRFVNNSLSSQKSMKSLDSAFISISLGINELLKFEYSERTKKMAADTFQLWAFEFYLSHNKLYKKSIRKINDYGGSAVKYPSGGITELLIKFLGWKLTKRIKLLICKIQS